MCNLHSQFAICMFIYALQSNMDTKNTSITNSCLQQSLFHSLNLKYFNDVLESKVPSTLLQLQLVYDF